MENMERLNFWKGKKVLVTGHTGFKGTWLTIWLQSLGAEVIGYSLEKSPNNKMFNETKISSKIIDVRGDIRDITKLKNTIEKYSPEIIFHLAAQPLVRISYDNPVETFETNVIGTVNTLECIRHYDFLKAGVIITTDKCYKNKEKEDGYIEDDELGGHDPYSASKACAELVIDSYRKSFFNHQAKFVASARAGNVIGGGDYSEDRIVPDCINALKSNKEILIRSPNSTRPWQHVIEPVYGYILLGEKLLKNEKNFAESWNFGPEKESIIPVNELVEKIIKEWGSGNFKDISNSHEKKHETKKLSLNISKVKQKLEWTPKLNIDKSIQMTVDWYKREEKEDAYDLCMRQIEEYNLILKDSYV